MSAYYCKRVAAFLEDSNSSIVGDLVAANSRAKFLQVEHSQTDVWQSSVEALQNALREVSKKNSHCARWGIALEFPAPRRLRRADVVLLAGELIIVLELKTGEAGLAAVQQVEEYALDLRDFHSESLGHWIQPVIVSRTRKFSEEPAYHSSIVQPVRWIATERLTDYFEELAADTRSKAAQIDCDQWNAGVYRPVPTIIEAALAIFAGMEVREIAHAHAEPVNLTATVDALVSVVEHSRESNAKTICFVTGVPGSGKTLAGLRAVHDSRLQALGPGAVSFLSGNGPLVRILREALLRDRAKRTGRRRYQLKREVETLIQNVHVFADSSWEDRERRPPVEKIVVFDEAQRAWDADRNRRKFKRDISEPNMLLEIMNRHEDWCVLVALVGGGQEIHDGEAGLAEWGRALLDKFPHWQVYASTEAVVGGVSVADTSLFPESDRPANTKIRDVLHLNVSARSYRAQRLAEWCNALLRGDAKACRSILETADEFPVYVTRDLNRAKRWLRTKVRASERCGLVASSGALRLRAHGIELSSSFHRDYPYEYWFLNDASDVRSSFQLEVVATEFEIQGLELDFVGVCWGHDFVWDSGRGCWNSRRFVGSKWVAINSERQQRYLANSYRVLLTRARQGVVIWVPEGDRRDETRDPKLVDDTAEFLKVAGLAELPTG